jgi:hypothetical protein
MCFRHVRVAGERSWAFQGIEASILIVESGFLIAPGCGLARPRGA